MCTDRGFVEFQDHCIGQHLLICLFVYLVGWLVVWILAFVCLLYTGHWAVCTDRGFVEGQDHCIGQH